MNVVITGVAREVPENRTVAELLQELDLEGKPTAVEVNRKVIPKAELQQTLLQEGDKIEIISFVGGG